ncbi:MAG: AAA family ATPase [Methanomicrobiales archaeon]
MKIGLLYVKGALPVFENFGNLPTHLVKPNGMVNGKRANEILDGLIIPGGTIVESQSINQDLAQEIMKMNKKELFILGMCSGFQVLAKKTDIGRKSPCPIEKEGLGILDVSFSPMISNDRVEAIITDNSFLTQGLVNQIVTGFHCHTYGKIEGEATPLFYSSVKRTDYKDNPLKVLSGVRNDEGNVIGTMLHGCLDENPLLVNNILSYVGADETDFLKIKEKNKNLIKSMKSEIGIDTNLIVRKSTKTIFKPTKNIPPMIMIASTGSDSGKTFLTTGIVGVLRSKGYKVGVLKVGPDIRDIVPSLYLNKENMESFSSIKIGHLGWKKLEEVLIHLKNKEYDLVIIEGVMSVLTGLLNEKIPYSSAEIAKAANIPIILVSACNKGGIESAAVDIVAHTLILNKMGIEIKGVILNKVYDKKIAKSAFNYIRDEINPQYIWEIPKIKITERGNIPEVEIKLEDFCLSAMNTIDKFLNAEEILKIAKKPNFTGYMSHKSILDFFR